MSSTPNDRRGRHWHRRRIEWLLAHPDTWEPFVFTPRSLTHQILFEMMQQCGFYSPTTAWYDTSIDRLVDQVRQIKADRERDLGLRR